MSDETEPTYPRAWLAWYLKPLVPEKWRILDSFTLPQTIDVPTVTITHTKIEPQPVAPRSSSLVNDVVIRVADPHVDIKNAEPALDEEVLKLVYLLKNSERLRWSSAEKVQVKDTDYYAWDITVQVLSTNPTTPAETE